MPYRLRMSAEIGDWIAELRSSAPGSPESLTATEIVAAIAATMSAVDPGDLAMITDLAGQAEPVSDSDLLAAVDHAYQQLLEGLQQLRRLVAEEGAFRSISRQRITRAGSEPAPFTAAEIAAHEKRERDLTKRAQRWQSEVDRFRTMREVAKARMTAAEGATQVQLALLASTAAAGGGLADIQQGEADVAAAEASQLVAKTAVVAVLAKARRLLAAIRAEVRSIEADVDGGSADGDSADGDSADGEGADDLADDTAVADSDAGPGVAAGLLELRADPLGADVRILCAVEPPGTLTLLAVLEGAGAIVAHRGQAIDLAGELLAELRAAALTEDESPTMAGDTTPGELTFTDAATFLAELCPDSDGQVARRAAVLTAASTLQSLRRQQGLSLDDLQTRTGMQSEELWKLETSGLRSARLSEVAAYLRALGATLTLQTDDGTAVVG
jgi:hypothetical protein